MPVRGKVRPVGKSEADRRPVAVSLQAGTELETKLTVDFRNTGETGQACHGVTQHS